MGERLRKLSAGFARRRIDMGLASLAVAFGWSSLTYPFGRDLGLYYYVGREWALRGSIPYRDVLDHKPPGIYIVHALCVTMFGETLAGIRIADLIAVVTLGWIAGGVIAKARALDHAPLRGVGAFSATVLFFGFLDFKASSEAEAWMALATLGSLALVQRRAADAGPRSRRARFASGALAGIALLMKPTAALLLLVVLGVVVAQRWGTLRVLAKELVVVVIGGAVVLGSVGLYFTAHGAVRAFKEIVVEGNALYVKSGSMSNESTMILSHTRDFARWFAPLSYALAFAMGAAILRAILRRDRASLGVHVTSAALCAAGWLSVVVQGKFFQGHWGVMIAGGAFVVTGLTADVVARFPRYAARVSAAACLAALVLFMLAGERAAAYRTLNRAAFRWVTGSSSRAEFTANFSELYGGGVVEHNEVVGNWIREHSTESDTIAVRGFQPQIYAIARRRYPGRLFWTVFAAGPAGAVHGAEWIADDYRRLARNPPRYVVTLSFVVDGSDGAPWWLARGYTERLRVGEFIVLERTPETATEPW